MNKRNVTWRMTAKAMAVLLLAPVIPALGGGTAAHAAEQQTKVMTQEEAITFAKKWVTVPAEYKLERAVYLDRGTTPYYRDKSSWRISWEKSKVGGITVTIDAQSGELLHYWSYSGEDQAASAEQPVSEEKALEIARKFLERVTTSDMRANLSKPNEYGQMHPLMQHEHTFTFTRMENGLPFLENGFQLMVGHEGEVVSFTREWAAGKLPDAKQAISEENAQKLLEKEAAPSLVYKEKASMTGRYDQDRGKYELVYQYDPLDPQYVDALSGDVINALGQPAEKHAVQALGSTIQSHSQQDKLITKDEAQKIAEQLIKRLPGSFRSDGSSGGGSSSGADGIERRHWRFDFTPLQSKDQADSVYLSIDDHGVLIEYSGKERFMHRNTGRKIEKAVPWEQAEANALKLVKALYADRLGEIYLIGKTPSQDSIKMVMERGGQFKIAFGWMKDGIPIENTVFDVAVNPETGEVENMRARYDDVPELNDLSTAQKIELTAAKKAEQDQKTLMLTYYLPQSMNYDMPSKDQQAMLVYRYVGDLGVVSATTGEWISFEKMRKDQNPKDIGEHSQKAALEFAVRQGFLTVTDGKVEPDKEVTRGEMALILSRLTDRIEFHQSMYSGFDDDGEDKRYVFADVDQKHPQYAAIQRVVQYGLIPKEGKRFEPDRPITRAEAADMVARLLGYSDLLNKPGIFAAAYPDVQKNDVPAVTLVTAQGLLPGKSTASFEPNATITRAQVAELVQALLKLKDSSKQ